VTVLKVDGLSKEFGGVHAVKGLDFTIRRGHIHSIIGPNGAGKTTLFNLITGVYAPTAGTIEFDDRIINGLKPHELAGLGMSRTFQNLQVFLNMTAVENVMVGMHLHLDRRMLPALFRFAGIERREREARERARELMRFVGLEAFLDAHASAMPYGALKRLEIARALAAKPSMLLLDEPAAGLNASETQGIDELIRKVSETGVTVVLVEHDMRLVMGISDHILVLDNGHKLGEGSAEQIRNDPRVIAAYLGAMHLGEEALHEH
jgi:branched-chain amino acid transport system ATP-binding protein